MRSSVNVNDPNRAPLTELLRDAIKEVPEFLSFHDLRIVAGPTHTNVIFDVVVCHSCKMSEQEILHYFNQKLSEYDDTFFAAINIDKSFLRNC